MQFFKLSRYYSLKKSYTRYLNYWTFIQNWRQNFKFTNFSKKKFFFLKSYRVESLINRIKYILQWSKNINFTKNRKFSLHYATKWVIRHNWVNYLFTTRYQSTFMPFFYYLNKYWSYKFITPTLSNIMSNRLNFPMTLKSLILKNECLTNNINIKLNINIQKSDYTSKQYIWASNWMNLRQNSVVLNRQLSYLYSYSHIFLNNIKFFEKSSKKEKIITFKLLLESKFIVEKNQLVKKHFQIGKNSRIPKVKKKKTKHTSLIQLHLNKKKYRKFLFNKYKIY